MKKIFSLMVCAALFLPAIQPEAVAQLRKTPAEATEHFSETYPNAANVEWKDRLVGFSAEFTFQDTAYLVNYNNNGRWESTEHTIDLSDIPAEVYDGFEKSRYTEWTMQKADKIELPDNKTQYRILIASGDIKKRNLYFNTKGRMVKDKITL